MAKSSFNEGIPLHALDKFSFSDEGAQLIKKHYPNLCVVHESKIEDVAKAVNNGELGLLPFENSSSGVVVPHFDMLCRNMWQIVGDASIKVRMCVGANSPVDPRSATVVRSHPKALEQCSFYVKSLPAVQEALPANSTAEAAEHLAKHPDAGEIVLASRLAIESLGLVVLDSDVANLKGDQNVTQFFALQKNSRETADSEQRFHSAIISPKNTRGILNDITRVIKDGNVDLRSLHSRTIGHKQYQFFVEMERQGSPEQFDAVMQQLNEHEGISQMQWLGSWSDSFHSS